MAAVSSDPDTLYVEYTGSGTNNITSTFAANEVVTGGSGSSKTATTASSSHSGKGSKADISEGVYFISGSMVYVGAQTLILDKYTNEKIASHTLEFIRQLLSI